ncbi:hypothetical protein ABEB36_001497 [Hypothenemus hampei]|uniref:Cationic amino acid transporter n=1 Tax=Hypothenemus hampei TaxID=57062 RepID=A0ABD1FER6_HYPHA
MENLQDVFPILIHWGFGTTILIGLVASGFSAAETILAIFLAGSTSTISALCSCITVPEELDRVSKRNRLNHLLKFLVLWLDILTNLVAAATCARLASATIDYISKGHFREILFGLEQHSLGEPWPDVLGVTIMLVVTALFMMGLEKSPAITILLLFALIFNFTFFTTIGCFHTVNNFQKLMDSFKIHSVRTVMNAAAICSFGFVSRVPLTSRNNCVKITILYFLPMVLYMVLTIIFSLMTRYRELEGTAIPLIQVFQSRDVDWARPLIAVCTICVVCLLLTEVLPNVYLTFVELAGKEWKVFVSSIQYQSPVTGAPVLAIFAAGSLAAILAFACPLSHLIKLLNVSSLIRCVLNSCQLVYNRYRPDILYNDLEVCPNTRIEYRKLNNNANRTSSTTCPTLVERIKGLFKKTPQYIHKLSSPKGPMSSIRKIPRTKRRQEEQECLLFENKSLGLRIQEEESNSENEGHDMEMTSCTDGESSASSTDIDVIVEEYKEGLRVSTLGTFNDRQPSTRLTSYIVIGCLLLIILASVTLSLTIFHVIKFYWSDILVLLGVSLVITGLPANASEKSKPCLLPGLIFPIVHCVNMTLNTVILSTIVASIWEGIVFWTIAGLVLYWKCDCCCQCETLEPLVSRTTAKIDPQLTVYEVKENLPENIIIAR